MLTFFIGACSTLLPINGEKVQAIVDRRVVGVLVGDFFDRYGAPLTRHEALDGTITFDWEKAGRAIMGTGPGGPEERCRLRITADKAGRIIAAPIVLDGLGQQRVSRCAEVFG